MDLRSGHPFWLLKNGILAAFPALAADLTCDVAVIGAGITGALITHALQREGLQIVVLDKRDVAWGSTSASTALLQYEIDTELRDLKQIVGPNHAHRAYALGVDAIAAIGAIAASLGAETGFCPTPSVYVTRRKEDVEGLQEEYAARHAMGLDVAFVTAETLRRDYALQAEAAIVSQVGARLDPYRFTYALFTQAQAQGVRIYDRTEVTGFEQITGGVRLTTGSGHRVTAAKIVFATGYESGAYLRHKVADLHSTYALVSEPVDPGIIERLSYLLWETARPYFYLRTTLDNRIIAGGADEPFRNPTARDRLIGRKTKQLLKQFTAFYPSLPPLDVAYAWAGTFGATQDGLAYIGETGDFPNAYFALGYGGNGVTYSLIAARLIADAIMGRPNPDAAIFRFSR
ncbi:MAG: hypothetical protein DCC57_10375 [Chloroflexi bacterium]|nr:MAG: hypothetical protein DCC57_10375 [Chloroflexota bacterium]